MDKNPSKIKISEPNNVKQLNKHKYIYIYIYIYLESVDQKNEMIKDEND